MAVVDDGGWLPDKESAVVDANPSTARFERWKGHRQLLITLILVVASVLLFAIVAGALIYIYYIPHPMKPKIPQKTCEKMYCAYGALCQVDHVTQQAYCRCEESCSELFAPVCGSDGVTYSSDCRLRMASCTQQRRIYVHHQGQCDAKDPCEKKECLYGAQCRPSLDGRTAECLCPDKCATYGDSRGSRPVCGTDGRDYPNDCELRRTSCKQMREISIKFQGRCDPCDGVDCPTSQVCQLDENRNPICRCNSFCSQDLKPVCGSDGKTYTNECSLRVESCKTRKSIRIVYTGECSAGANPCEGLECGPGEECDIDRYGIATCQCPPNCEPVMRPVCGSDARTYPNACELMRHACMSKREISLMFRGECGDSGPCYKRECFFGSVCVTKGSYSVCECPSCTEEFEPVCGTDGISYTNLCKLKREGCEQKIEIQVAYNGLCSGCKNKVCEFYSVCEDGGQEEARCVCPQSCSEVDSPVCGTDGVTYRNECEMQVAACNKQQFVVVGAKGPCDLCQDVHCKYGARCENGQCVCPTDCPVDLYEAVCATDGTTYYNECEMRRSACIQSRELNVQFYGECEDVGSSGQDANSGSGGCEEKVCNYASTCEYDTDGLPVCVCNFDCPSTGEPICGSDGAIHANECRLKEESCRQQQQLYKLPMPMCEDYRDVPCDSEMPLLDPLTGEEYFCGEGFGAKQCPPSSYCHKTPTFAKCCREIALIKTCADSAFGCCPDEKTAAIGPNYAGCPSVCNCNRLGSYGLTCDAETKQCSCKPGVGGQRCDRCEPGYWGLHKATEGSAGCSSCNCNLLGSVRDDCEQMTGRCVCKQGIKGMKCDTCPQGTVLGPNGCTDASISQPVTGSCFSLTCLHGAVCKEREEGGLTAQCVCDFHCSGDNQSICGSDGNTYGSQCQMRQFSCRYQKPISVQYDGPCKRREGQVDEPTPGPVRRSTVQRIAAAEPSETKSTRDIVINQPESYQLTTRPTVATPIVADEAVEVPSFSGRSYLELPRLQAYARLSLEMEFQSFSNDGILLYNGQTSSGVGDFVALSIRGGYVEFRYDLGNGPVILRSPQKLHLGKFHRLVAKRYLREGLLALDGQSDVAGRSQGSLKSLDLSENLFLGYIPSEKKRIFENIAVRTGMIGCIRKLKIGKKEIDLRHPFSKDIIRGSNIRECGTSPCLRQPCQNNGICEHHLKSGFRCICLPGFTGTSCEILEHPCFNNPCPDGLTCQFEEENSFSCICQPGHNGKTCTSDGRNAEIILPDFDGQSYLEFPTLSNVQHSFSIELWFLSRSPDGTLLYNGQTEIGRGDFVAITLAGGHVVFRFDVGSIDPAISSYDPVSLNRWHSVKANRLWKNGTLQVDNGTLITAETSTSLTELNLELNLYLGGVPNLDRVNPDAVIRTGLNGALQRMVVNGATWSDLLSSAISSYGVKRYWGPPCGGPTTNETTKKCLNGGVCVPQLNRVSCSCPLRFRGPKCEKRITEEDLKRPVAFNGNTFLTFPTNVISVAEGQRETNIEITFRTTSARGLLLWTQGGSASSIGGSDYLALAIVDGRVKLSFNLGKQLGDALLVTSEAKVDDQRWHTAFVQRNMRVCTLTVDDNEPVRETSSPGATELNTDGVYWIGGFHNLPFGLPEGFYAGFEGCIKSVIIDGEPLHLVLQRIQDVTFCDTP